MVGVLFCAVLKGKGVKELGLLLQATETLDPGVTCFTHRYGHLAYTGQ